MVGQKRNLAQSSPRKAAQVAERKVVTLKRRRGGLSGAMLEGFVLRARRVVGLKGTVNVLVTASSEMRVLNRRFGGRDKPTDVLSFPALAQIEGGKFAGDVAVCADIAGRIVHLRPKKRGREQQQSCANMLKQSHGHGTTIVSRG